MGAGTGRDGGRRVALLLVGMIVVTAAATVAVTMVLVTMFQHKQAARTPFVRVVEVDEGTTDPAPWGMNWPRQYDGYLRTAGDARFGGSSAMTASKLEEDPWLRRLYAGYAFSIDYREARGHAFMLADQEATERVTERQQSGACLHCHASIIPTYRRIGLEDAGAPADAEALAEGFRWDAVMRGFELVSRRPYEEVHAELMATPDGTAGDGGSGAHPVSCVDCHDPETMAIRVTRPGFVRGIRALAEGDAPVPHLPSIVAWRDGSRSRAYDPNVDASRQEMRSLVCGQCHVEYYCADKMTLTFPWGEGLKMDDIERFWEGTVFPDGGAFYDYKHGETGAPVYKAQHPEFELWSQGIHAANGVSCADCHMPYQREGAMKVSSHDVRSPMESVNSSCQTCHNVSEDEIRSNVATIQGRTRGLMDRAASAMTEMLDAIREAQAAGASSGELAEVFELQRKAMWRLDYISSENSLGFHAPQEAARVLGESIDYSRRAQAMALRLRAPAAPSTDGLPTEPVRGVTERGE